MKKDNVIYCEFAECLLNHYGVCTCGSNVRGECDCNAVRTEAPEE